MINKKNYVFEYTCGEDYLVYKGFHFIIVRYGNDEENKDNFISIINTHMNARMNVHMNPHMNIKCIPT